MRAMILAAGFGSRLKPLTDTTPKPLLNVAGKPMIAYPLELVAAAGIKDVVVNLHHLGDQIRARLGDGREWGLRIHYSEEPQLLDTGGAIAAARPYLRDEPFVVINADVYVEGSLQNLIEFHQRTEGIASLWVRPDPQANRHDDLRVDATGRIHAILGYAAHSMSAQRLPRYFYAGVMVCSPQIFRYLQPGIYSLTRHTLTQILVAGEPLFAQEHRGFWCVLDTPKDLETGRREIAKRRGQLPDS